MSNQRYKTTGDRAHLSKGLWKKLIAFIAAELQKPRNTVGLAGRESDQEEWNLWFHQFFCNYLEGRFWMSTNQGRKALEKHRDEIVQHVKSRCDDTARKIRNAKLAKRDKANKCNRLNIPARHPAKLEGEGSPIKETGDLRNEYNDGNGPDNHTPTTEPGSHASLHLLTASEDIELGGLLTSLDRLDVPAPGMTFGQQQHPNGRVLPTLDNQPPKESDNDSASAPASPAEPVKESLHEVIAHNRPGSLSSDSLLRARSLRKRHAPPATIRTQNLYAWAIKIHGPPRHSNPIREIMYRKTIPSLRRFLCGIMAARKLSSRFSVRTLVVSAAGDAFRVKVNSTQEKLDWKFIASRFFEIGMLVDVDVWVS